MTGTQTFAEVIAAAIRDIAEHGFDSPDRIEAWTIRIREAAERSMVPPEVVERELTGALRATYRRLIEEGSILNHHPGVSKFVLQQVAPRLRGELDRRLMASRELIKLNRKAAIERTTQRFAGWATSIPAGGSDAVEKVETKTEIRKALASLPFEERRVAIDQGHKFVSNLNNILATDGGAIAGRWHSNFRQANYNYREDHKERDQRIYVLRGNWALEKGLMKLDGNQYTDEVTAPGEEVYCRCRYRYVYSLRDLPPSMVTDKGRA